MAKDFTVLIDQDEEGYFIAEVPELKGCLHRQSLLILKTAVISTDFTDKDNEKERGQA